MNNSAFVALAFTLTWVVLLGTLVRVTGAHRRARAMLVQASVDAVNSRELP